MLQALIGPVTGLLDKFVEDKDQKAALAHEIATMAEKQAHQSAMAQIEVNKAEAQSGSIFKGGWRPFIGWVLCLSGCLSCLFVCPPTTTASFIQATYQSLLSSALPRTIKPRC
jgi:hypothetical protein